MITMKILKVDGKEFTGNSGGKPTKDIYMAHEGADALVLMTAHREFRELDLRRAKERMRTPIMIDGRRVFDQSHVSGGRVQHFGWTILEQDEVRGLGFVYRGVGAGNDKENSLYELIM